MLLGDVLEQLGDAAFAAETLVALDDLPLMAGVEAEASRQGESAGLYAAAAVRRFAAFANDEDWLALVGVLGRAADPGAACLRHMLAWCLRHDGECGGECADACAGEGADH
jgi:hypothetical protein